MRFFITGAGGQVGRELTELCTALGDDVVACDQRELDVTDRDAVLQAILSVRPDAVVHAAAWTAVDACENDPDRAFRVNGVGTRNVAEGCVRADAHLVYLSTDYVFDGTMPRPYVEWDRPNPESVYGRSKLAGEQEITTIAPGSTTARTSWVSGRYGNNMVKTALRLAAERETLSFVDDQRGQPTFVSDLVPMLRRFAVERRPGLFHVTNQGAVSWYEFVRAVFSAAGLDPDRILPIGTADLNPPRPAPRPANSVLDNAALRLSGLPLLRDFREPLTELTRLIRS